MTDSKRQTIFDAIDVRFKKILVYAGSGYETNLGKNVFAWRTTPLTEDELPGLAYRDMDEVADISIGQWEHGLQLEIDIHVKHDANAMAELRKAIKDVVTAIGTDVTFGGLTEDVAPRSVNRSLQQEFIKIIQNDGRFASCTMAFNVTYLTDRWSV